MSKDLVKVQFYDADIGYESIWASPVGDGTYRLENSPFFVYGVSLDDVVAATRVEEDIQFLAVVSHSGNRTLRTRSDSMFQETQFRSKVEHHLQNMGCRVENHRNRLLSINVPPEVDLEEVAAYLTGLSLAWEYGFPEELNAPA
jgi:hypothetical protein